MGCARCDGTGWRPIDREGVRRVVRCECWIDTRADERLASARVPPRYAGCDLDNFVLYANEKLAAALQRARRFAESFPAVDRGLCLVGPPGIGKTHIAASILRKVVTEKAVHGLFCDVRELLKTIRSTYNPVVRTAEMDVLRPVMEAELLVLDDLGAEKPSEWVEETMNLIVNTRYNERRPTLFTTNYLDTNDEADLDSLRVRVGFRLHSRLHEMCEFLEYDGGDYRMLPVNGGPDDLLALWKRRGNRRVLPARAASQARADMRQVREPRELNWPGGKAGTK